MQEPGREIEQAGRGTTRQLSDLPKDELDLLAEEFGLEVAAFKTRQHLVSAIHDRRQAIAIMDREAMLDVVKWGRRPVSLDAGREQIAQEIARIRSMNFSGLSHRGLLILSRMRGVMVAIDDPVPVIIRKLKRQEGIFEKLNRKRRAVLGGLVSRMIGDDDSGEYRFLPPASGNNASSIKEEIEEAGLLGGISSRIKRSADTYLNQKLDEIEARIDRKLNEIDKRLAEWRDKEIANRIRILKFTLYASVIVAVISLIYSFVKVHFGGK